MKRSSKAFTLAELLIALGILGVIATFTIPKVLQSQQDQKFKAIAKETAGMIASAYQLYQMDHSVTASTTIQDILDNSLNYVAIDTTSSVDVDPDNGGVTITCNATDKCYKLHNGAMIWTWPVSFDGTNSTNATYLLLDPDGVVTNQTDSLTFLIYYDGKIRTWESAITGTCSGGPLAANPTGDPSWFSWN